MGRPKGAHDDDAKWPEENENAFLEILSEKVKEGPSGKKSLDPLCWPEIDKELFLATGVKYGIERLKGKYGRVRWKHTCFSRLLWHPSVTYDSESNTVSAPEQVWQMFCKKNKVFKSFKSMGCKNYGLLSQVFGNSKALVHSPHTSQQSLPISDEECQNEDELFQRSSMHVTEVGKYNAESCSAKHDKSNIVLSPHVEKKRRVDKLDASSSSKLQKDRSNEKRQRLQSFHGTDSEDDPYSIADCMDVLEMEEDISDASYSKAVEKLIHRDWRIIFMNMSDRRRKAWLQNL